jgi:hypothetical protein
MKIAFVVIGVLLLSLLAFIAWRWTSVARGAKERDERLLVLLDPLGSKLESGAAISLDEVESLAAKPELRFMLFAALRHMNRTDLLPRKYLSSVDQGASALAYWMMHPNELQDAPEAIEWIETVQRPVDGRIADFHVYRYRMGNGNWAAESGWLLGLAGPMFAGAEPYLERPGAFSRAGDIEGSVKPSELVDWYIGILRQKGMIK